MKHKEKRGFCRRKIIKAVLKERNIAHVGRGNEGLMLWFRVS